MYIKVVTNNKGCFLLIMKKYLKVKQIEGYHSTLKVEKNPT